MNRLTNQPINPTKPTNTVRRREKDEAVAEAVAERDEAVGKVGAMK
jgi:hypothetical protein